MQEFDWTRADLFAALIRASLVERMLDPTDEFRRFEHFPEWSQQVQVATFQSGGGDHLVVIRAGSSSAIKGFAHESPSSPYAQPGLKPLAGMYMGMPGELMRAVEAVNLPPDDVTFALWQEQPSRIWTRGITGSEDGLDALLIHIPLSGQGCIDRWEEVLERDLTIQERGAIWELYGTEPPIGRDQ